MCLELPVIIRDKKLKILMAAYVAQIVRVLVQYHLQKVICYVL